MWLDSRE